MNTREAKLHKRRQYQIHKAKVKKSYYKLLKKENLDDSVDKVDNAELSQNKQRIRYLSPIHNRMNPLEMMAKKSSLENTIKSQRQKEKEESQREREQLREEYQRKRNFINKKMRTKTKRGQPVLGDRIDAILEKLKSS